MCVWVRPSRCLIEPIFHGFVELIPVLARVFGENCTAVLEISLSQLLLVLKVLPTLRDPTLPYLWGAVLAAL